MSASGKITAARTNLVLETPFFGSLILGLKMVEDRTCKTAWVNGRELGYNPKFVDGLSNDQIEALLAHEVMHVALGHPWRKNDRNHREWNISCDKAINGELRESFKLPDDVHYPEGDEVGKSAEWIYGRRQQKPQQDEQEQEEQEPGDGPGEDEPGEGDGGDEEGEGEGEEEGDGDGEDDGDGEPGEGEGDGNGEGEGDPLGEVRDAPTTEDDEGNPAPTEQDWKQKVATAAMQAQAQGDLPAGMARLVQQALKPKIDVRSLLLRFFSERAKGDYSWTRPNTRYLSQNLYLPALHSETLGEVAIMVDTSGSIDDVALAKARGIVESVIEECNPARVSMYYADAEVQHVDHFEQGEPLEWPGKDTKIGGGGTDFQPALEAIERDEVPVCVVCITDLYGSFPSVPPSIPVLWLSTTENKQAPFGETVYCDE
jgi:predicted metal-dependent peptidase